MPSSSWLLLLPMETLRSHHKEAIPSQPDHLWTRRNPVQQDAVVPVAGYCRIPQDGEMWEATILGEEHATTVARWATSPESAENQLLESHLGALPPPQLTTSPC